MEQREKEKVDALVQVCKDYDMHPLEAVVCLAWSLHWHIFFPHGGEDENKPIKCLTIGTRSAIQELVEIMGGK